MEVIDGSGPQKRPELPPHLIRYVVIGIVALVIIGFGYTMFYTVQEQEKAAILTFGTYTETVEEPGLKFKWPYPIQQVVKVPANLTQTIQIGYRERNGQIEAVEDESMMITGDENIVSADAVVEWRISDVGAYLYDIRDAERFLRNSASASIRSVIGSTNLDYAITDGKTVIQEEVKKKLIELQQKYNTGIQILDVKFQDIEPPEGEVQQAFKEVTNAREEKNTKINNANQYKNARLPRARGEAQSLIQQAEADKKSRILNAQGDVAKFNAIYAEYVNHPDITEERLILETLETILPNAKIVITDSSGGETVQYLPLNELIRPGTSRPAQQSTNTSANASAGQGGTTP